MSRTSTAAGAPVSLPADPGVAVARRAALGLFFVNGLTLSAWVARVPAVRDALGLSPAGLGSLLLAVAVGGVLAMTIAPAVVTRIGTAAAVRWSGALYAAGYLLVAGGVLAAAVPVVAGGLVLVGVAFAGGNLPLNLASTHIERRVGRPILPQFHAAFSIGTVAGSLAGAGAAALAVPVPAQLVAMAVLAVGWRWWATPLLLPDERGVRRAAPARAPAGPARRPVPAPSRGRRLARPDARALLVGVVALAASASELGANDWLALGVVDGFGAGQSTAAVTFGVFVGAMTLVRLVGTPVLARFGRVAVLRASAALAIVGIVVFVTAPSLPVAVAGVAAWGAGSALNFPIAISAASDEPRRAALRVATLSAFAAGAGLVGPLVIGALGEQVGVRSAVLVIAIVLGTVLLVAGRAARVEPERVEPGRGEPERVELEATVAPEPAPAVTGRRAEVALAVGHAA